MGNDQVIFPVDVDYVPLTDYSRFYRALELHDAVAEAWHNMKPQIGEKVRGRRKGEKYNVYELGWFVWNETNNVDDYVWLMFNQKKEIVTFLFNKLLHHLNTTFPYPSYQGMITCEQDEIELESCKNILNFASTWEGAKNGAPKRNWHTQSQEQFEEIQSQWRRERHAEFDRRMRAIPPEFMESLMPVVLLRNLLAVRKVQFDPALPFPVKGKNVVPNPFKTFSDRYKHIIISA